MVSTSEHSIAVNKKKKQMSSELNSDIQVLLYSEHGSFFQHNDLAIKLAAAFNRKPLPEEYELSINKIWSERLKNNPKLWNGTKFRLDSVQRSDTSFTVTLNIGLTCYKDFIGTNWSPNAKKLLELGWQNHRNRQAYMSDALGVGAFVQTADDCFILLRRSKHCGEAVGLLDLPGGHPEPEQLVGPVEYQHVNTEMLSPADVLQELFDSILREITDEVNIPSTSLTCLKLIGIIRSSESCGKPTAEFHVRCSLPSAEVLERYLKGGNEAEESTDIVFVPVASLNSTQQNNDIWHHLTPSAKGCLTMYCKNTH